MPNLTKKAIRYGLTEPNYKKASLLKRAINVKTFFFPNTKTTQI